jgi:hypothetical protein
MKERKVPVPPYHPCADKDNNGEPVQGLLCIRGRAKRRGKKSLMSVQVFIEHFKKSLNKPLFLLENPAPSAVLIF